MGWRELHQEAASRHGVASSRCAEAAGVPRNTFADRARREAWPEPFPGAFVLPGWPVTGLARTIAAALSVGGDAVVTGASALALHGLVRVAPSTVELLVPDNHRRVHHPWIRTRWTVDLAASAVTTVAGLQVADVARSLADHASDATAERLRYLGIDATIQGLLAAADMDRELAARGRFPGRGRYRQVRSDLQADGSDSGFEFDVRERLEGDGLHPDPEQAIVRTHRTDRRIDIPFGRELVGIECLGFAFHSTPRQLEQDVVRSNEIAVLDRWLLLRLTWAMFHRSWEPFLDQLRDCLRRRSEQAHVR